ncbi:1-acyl-sn-glycerol-3-phosphate acyltransferase [filamentous cyanobacterium CCP5]|nr:1-acyl-sn-glycerol-3-phosphate acyltransferase [filamentous cyanobacterium CCP5]
MVEVPDFFPPRLTPWLVRLVQLLAPGLARWLFQFKLEIDPEHRQRLRQVEGHRLLLLPNHPTFHDPIVMFVLSRQLKRPCYFMAAHETFVDPSVMFSISGVLTPLEGLTRSRWFTRLFRRFLQGLGMYSVHRGLPDRPSVAATLDLIRQPESQLVIFPEGGCSFQNDTVMPFRAGAIQLALQGLSRFAKQQTEIPDLYAVPIAIKYQYTRNMAGEIQASLERLEAALDLHPPQSPSIPSQYERLRAIGAAVLSRLEREYGLEAGSKAAPWTDRVDTLKHHVVSQIEEILGIKAADTYLRERVYRIRHRLQEQSEPATGSQGAKIEQATRRLLNFDAIYDGYVAKLPTQERFLDTLIRLEREVFDIDQPPPKGFRKAQVLIAEPINLSTHHQAFSQDKAATVKCLTDQIQQAVQANLDQFNQSDPPESLSTTLSPG